MSTVAVNRRKNKKIEMSPNTESSKDMVHRLFFERGEHSETTSAPPRPLRYKIHFKQKYFAELHFPTDHPGTIGVLGDVI